MPNPPTGTNIVCYPIYLIINSSRIRKGEGNERERELQQSMNFSNNQEDSSASSTTNTTQDITQITNDYGPVHTLLEICKNDMISDVYKCMKDDVIFC